MVVFFLALFAATACVHADFINLADFPYQVSLRQRGLHFCGGTLLDDKHVLSAARCFDNDEEVTGLSVVAGNHLLGGVSNTGSEQPIAQVYIHDEYNPLSNFNDIALIRLKEPFIESQFIAPVPRWTGPPPSDFQFCNVTGWRKLKEGGNPTPDLRKHEVSVLPNGQCGLFKITQEMFCASGDKESACTADTGGPLVCQRKLLGISSWGPPCNADTFVRVYTNVTYLEKWIDRTLEASRKSSSTILSPTFVAYLFTMLTCYFLRK